MTFEDPTQSDNNAMFSARWETYRVVTDANEIEIELSATYVKNVVTGCSWNELPNTVILFKKSKIIVLWNSLYLYL